MSVWSPTESPPRPLLQVSDYAVGQFKYLVRLLLVHGRWSYKRNKEVGIHLGTHLGIHLGMHLGTHTIKRLEGRLRVRVDYETTSLVRCYLCPAVIGDRRERCGIMIADPPPALLHTSPKNKIKLAHTHMNTHEHTPEKLV
eukprot:4571563-Pyramimonas_sp.AAC.1